MSAYDVQALGRSFPSDDHRDASVAMSGAPAIMSEWPTLGIALFMTGFPIMLHFISQPLAIGCCVCCAVLIALWFESAAPTVLFAVYMFQGSFISLFSSLAVVSKDLDPVRAYSFITTVSLWAALMLRYCRDYPTLSPLMRRLVVLSTLILAISGIYFVAGLAVDPTNATIYMRNMGLPIMLFQICLIVASKHSFSLKANVTILLSILLICGYFELFFNEQWLALTNGRTYWTLANATFLTNPGWLKAAQHNGMVITDVMDMMKFRILNTNLLSGIDITINRLEGPNFHPISFGYVLAILAAFAAVNGRASLALLCLPLLLFVSAKGAIVLLFGGVLFTLCARVYDGPWLRAGLAAILAVYAVLIFYLGMGSGDFHVLGFLGGLNGFLANPIGHTLGDGGNLSTDFGSLDWSAFQHAGAAAVAVESAVGVMLYQFGLAAFVILAIYLWISQIAWRLFRTLHAPALALSSAFIAIMLVNGIFQEEALFAPLAFGLVMAFAGLSLGASDLVLRHQAAAKARSHP